MDSPAGMTGIHTDSTSLVESEHYSLGLSQPGMIAMVDSIPMLLEKPLGLN